MESAPKMDVGDWQDSPLPIVPKTKARRCFLPPTLIGILGTLLLHAMLVQSVSFVSRGPKPKPLETQESASALSKSNTGEDSLVLISLPTTANATLSAIQNVVSSFPELSKVRVKPQIDVDSPASMDLESLALSEGETSSAVAASANGAELARLFGIYTGQIRARIDRVWRRPRTPVNEERNTGDKKAETADESFQCEAQIVQDVGGYVQEILLPRCNGSSAWQHSLVLAIQQASPLPSPPDAAVFNRSITLSFLGLPYSKGAAEDEYETASSLAKVIE